MCARPGQLGQLRVQRGSPLGRLRHVRGEPLVRRVEREQGLEPRVVAEPHGSAELERGTADAHRGEGQAGDQRDGCDDDEREDHRQIVERRFEVVRFATVR